MELDLDGFVRQPKLEQLNKCRKVDLMLIANSYKVEVPSGIKKEELRQLLVEKLSERGLLSVSAVAESVGKTDVELREPVPRVTPVLSDPPLTSGLSAEELRLTLCIKEMEMKNSQLEVEAMHLRVKALELERQPNVAPRSPVAPQDPQSLRPNWLIALVPPFRESEVDSYFSAFERIAATLNWPKDVWTLLLQCKLVGKAQEVCAALTVEQSLNYDIVKASVLRAYELVPEAYRQKFRTV